MSSSSDRRSKRTSLSATWSLRSRTSPMSDPVGRRNREFGPVTSALLTHNRGRRHRETNHCYQTSTVEKASHCHRILQAMVYAGEKNDRPTTLDSLATVPIENPQRERRTRIPSNNVRVVCRTSPSMSSVAWICPSIHSDARPCIALQAT